MVLKIDHDLIIKPNLTITEGGILPFANMFDHDTWYSRLIATACEQNGIDVRQSLSHLTNDQMKILLHGTGNRQYRVSGENKQGKLTSITEKFIGIIPELERRYHETESEWIRNEIEKYMRKETCATCHGTRLKPETLSVTIDGHHIASVTSWSIDRTLTWAKSLLTQQDLSQRESTIADPILREITARLQFLISVGLDYLTLDRPAGTLAGGEAQRIRLASQIGSGLSGVLYVLDEPSIGLHARDNQRLINSLTYLRDLGNTVIVVEHDQEMMESSDWLIDFGPGAGKHGGAVIAAGTPSDVKKDPNSLTGKYLSGKKTVSPPLSTLQTPPTPKRLTLSGASQHNLQNLTIDFPLGNFITVTGVSGSGK